MPTWRIYVFALVMIGMVVSFGYLRLSGSTLASSPISAEPVIDQTVVTDASILEKTNPVFYEGAKDGDVVVRYQNRIELYRPSEQRIIRSVPLIK